MTELPPGWAIATLGEIGEYLNGRGFKKSEWRESGRPIIRIQNLTGSGNHVNYFDGEPEERYTARRGDLLVSWAATLGVFVWDGPEAVVNQHIFKVRSHVDRSFHRYLLLWVLNDLRRQTHGSGMVHITKSRFEETPVPLPPTRAGADRGGDRGAVLPPRRRRGVPPPRPRPSTANARSRVLARSRR